jgi:hypothetical protein
MTSQFQPNTLEWGDVVGLHVWEVGHYRQHLVYQQVLAARTPPVIIASYPIFHVGDRQQELRFWLTSHEQLHEILRSYTNVTGPVLSDVNFSKEGEFYDWIDIHNTEHALLDKAFGVG